MVCFEIDIIEVVSVSWVEWVEFHWVWFLWMWVYVFDYAIQQQHRESTEE